MSDLNLLYSSMNNAANNNNTKTSLWHDISKYSLAADATKKENEAAASQSLFKSYFNGLREKADDNTKKLLESLTNSPAGTTNRLFTNLQHTSIENISRLFEDLRIKPTDEVGTLLDAMNNGVDKTDEKNLTDTLLSKYAKDRSADQIKDRSVKETKENKENADKVSADNNKLAAVTDKMAKAVERTEKAFEKKEETTPKDRDEAYAAAEDFVNSYNSLSDAIKGEKNGTVSGKAGFIDDMLKAYSRSLEKVGITQDKNGDLSVNKDKLATADEKDIDKVFGKKDSFAEFIEGQTKQLSAYAQTDLYQRSSAYSDGGNITQISNISGSYFNMLG